MLKADRAKRHKFFFFMLAIFIRNNIIEFYYEFFLALLHF